MRIPLTGHGLLAEADTAGGELVSLRDSSGTEYIWQGEAPFWGGRNPVLFPVIGRLKGDAYLWNGVRYQMAKHGFARRSEFTVVEQADDHVVMELRETEETLAQYPFPFSLRICHRLTADGFSTTYRVANTGTEPMPFCIGSHTAFRCPLQPGERFEEYQLVFDRPEEIDTLLLTEGGLLRREAREPFLRGTNRYSLQYETFSRLDTVILEGLRSQTVRLLHSGSGRGICLDFSAFPILAVWTQGAQCAPFVCLEAWHGCAGAEDDTGVLADKAHCLIWKPGEARELTYTVALC